MRLSCQRPLTVAIYLWPLMCKSVVVQNVTSTRFRAPKSIRPASISSSVLAGAKMNVFLSYQLGDDLFFFFPMYNSSSGAVKLEGQPDLVPVNMNV